MPAPIIAALALLATIGPARATTLIVAESGGDHTTIQAALDAASPGDTVQVREKATPWFEKVTFPSSGAPGAFITLEAYPGEHPVVDGTGVVGANMVLLDHRSWVRVRGLVLRNNLDVSDGSGIRVVGAGSHIELLDNTIHDMRGQHAMGITVYGTEATSIADVLIDGNVIHDCEPATSEALTLNGNVERFVVSNNVVRDVNNIGIDAIGGEGDIQPDPTKVARDGVIRGNTVIRARSSYGGGFAAGIYVDGGRDIVIENNRVTESDLGIEIGAENAGITTRNVTVRDNVVHGNDKVCVVFGGYAAGVGRVRESTFTHNTCWHNDTLGAGFGELWIQYAEDNIVRNNVFVATAQGRLLTSDAGSIGNDLDWNLWHTTATPTFVLNGVEYIGLGAFVGATGLDTHSQFFDPMLVDPSAGDFHLDPASPAVDAGDPAFVPDVGEVDLDGGSRVSGPRSDQGADEAVVCGNGTVEVPEICDDGDQVSGDGCDANCTPTGCGNGITTSGETCDDGNVAPGDCCDASCQVEPNGSPCDDGAVCTPIDTCNAGACVGATVPATGCRTAAATSLVLKSTSRSLTWKWNRGAATTFADFGDPVAGTAYTLCIYDGGGIALAAEAPAGGSCGGKPCWKGLGATGFGYTDKAGTPDGLTKVTLKAGGDGLARIGVKAKGGNLPPLALPFAQSPATVVQLHRGDDALCWEASYTAPSTTNTSTQFGDKTP